MLALMDPAETMMYLQSFKTALLQHLNHFSIAVFSPAIRLSQYRYQSSGGSQTLYSYFTSGNQVDVLWGQLQSYAEL